MSRTTAALRAHEKAVEAVEEAIGACRRLARTGDSTAAREADLLALMLHRVSDVLVQCPTPIFQDGRWVR